MKPHSRSGFIPWMVLLILLAFLGATAVRASSNEQDDIQELERIRAERERSYSQVNQGNPMSLGFDPAKALNPMTTQAQMERFLKEPVGQRALQVLGDPRFQKVASEVREHPNRMNLLYFEGGWFVLIFILRMWRSAVITHWARRLWMRAWTGTMLLVGSTLIIPGLVIGGAYYRLLGMLGTIFGFGGFGY